MNRRDSWPARPSQADDYPESAQPYLEARAYPADPGYQGPGGGFPPGAARTRPERAVPPYPTRPDPVNRPWPDDGASPDLAPETGRRPRWARATRFRPVETDNPRSPNGFSPSRPAPPPPPGAGESQYGPGSSFDVFTPRNRVPGSEPRRQPGTAFDPGAPYARDPRRDTRQRGPGADPYGTRPGNQRWREPAPPRSAPAAPHPAGYGPGSATPGAHPYAPAGPQHPYGPPPGAGPDPAVTPPNPGPEGFERADGPVIRQRDSALPDAPPAGGTGPIAAIETDNVAAFARDLRVLRAESGLDYPDMADKSHYTMRTLAAAAGGLRLPTLPVLIAYVRACDGDQAEWEERWSKLMKASDGQSALPASGADAATAREPVTRESGPAAASPSRPGHAQAPTRADAVYVITSAPSRDDLR